MQLRIQVIAALDMQGSVYISVLQINTNTDVMLCFLTKLATILQREDAQFRKTVCIVLDGSAVNRNPLVKSHLVNLGIDYMISSP